MTNEQLVPYIGPDIFPVLAAFNRGLSAAEGRSNVLCRDVVMALYSHLNEERAAAGDYKVFPGYGRLAFKVGQQERDVLRVLSSPAFAALVKTEGTVGRGAKIRDLKPLVERLGEPAFVSSSPDPFPVIHALKSALHGARGVVVRDVAMAAYCTLRTGTDTYSVALSPTDIGDQIGRTRQNVNVALKQLIQLQLIERTGAGFYALDRLVRSVAVQAQLLEKEEAKLKQAKSDMHLDGLKRRAADDVRAEEIDNLLRRDIKIAAHPRVAQLLKSPAFADLQPHHRERALNRLKSVESSTEAIAMIMTYLDDPECRTV